MRQTTGGAQLGNKVLRLESKATDHRKRKSKTDFPVQCQLVEGRGGLTEAAILSRMINNTEIKVLPDKAIYITDCESNDVQ